MSPQICLGREGWVSHAPAGCWTANCEGRRGNKHSATYLDGRLELEEDGLRDEDLASLCAEETYLSLEQLDLLAGAAATDFEKTVDYGVQIDFAVICHGGCKERQQLA